MQIDSNLIARLGEMTCIELSPGEMEALAADLAQVAAGMERMGEVDSACEANGAANGAASESCADDDGFGGIANVFRDDEPRPSLPRELALASAPAQDGGAFVVPAAFVVQAPAPAVSG